MLTVGVSTESINTIPNLSSIHDKNTVKILLNLIRIQEHCSKLNPHIHIYTHTNYNICSVFI